MNDCSLFQVPITQKQLQQWYPLNVTCDNPYNCGPTALALANVIPRTVAQQYSYAVEIDGINLNEMTRLMVAYMRRHNFTLMLYQPIQYISSLINKLFTDHITILGLSNDTVIINATINHQKHITTMAKDSNGTIWIFDGQTQQQYSGESALTYLSNYKHFYYWCANIHLKRPFSNVVDFSNIINQSKNDDEQTLKKQKRGGRIKVPRRYLPAQLTRQDRRTQATSLRTSRRMYKRRIYHRRPNVASFRSTKSSHIKNAEAMYKVPSIGATDVLAKATGCSKRALAKIINKGAGAYYSSGSRPNQTAQSWGIARLASAITAGKASVIDYAILNKGCTSRSKALLLAQRAKTRKLRKASKVSI